MSEIISQQWVVVGAVCGFIALTGVLIVTFALLFDDMGEVLGFTKAMVSTASSHTLTNASNDVTVATTDDRLLLQADKDHYMNITTDGVVIAGDVDTNGIVSAATLNSKGSITAIDTVAAGNVTATGTVTGWNVTAGIVDATSIRTGSLTITSEISLPAGTVSTGTVSAHTITALGTITGGTLTSTGNINATSGTVTAGTISATGDLLGYGFQINPAPNWGGTHMMHSTAFRLGTTGWIGPYQGGDNQNQLAVLDDGMWHYHAGLNKTLFKQSMNNQNSTTGTLLRQESVRTATSSMHFLEGKCADGFKYRLTTEGNLLVTGSLQGNASIGDFAEYFESTDGTAIAIGTTVVFEPGTRGKIRAFDVSVDQTDAIVGVVRHKEAAFVIGGAASLSWSKKFVMDDFDVIQKESYVLYEWFNDDNKERHQWSTGDVLPSDETEESIKSKATMTTHTRNKLNPAYDPEAPYTPRAERAEWHLISLVGQVPVRANQHVSPRWIKLYDRSDTVSVYLVR